jgi:hypothetical protein
MEEKINKRVKEILEELSDLVDNGNFTESNETDIARLTEEINKTRTQIKNLEYNLTAELSLNRDHIQKLWEHNTKILDRLQLLERNGK